MRLARTPPGRATGQQGDDDATGAATRASGSAGGGTGGCATGRFQGTVRTAAGGISGAEAGARRNGYDAGADRGVRAGDCSEGAGVGGADRQDAPAARIAAERLIQHLERAGFVLMRSEPAAAPTTSNMPASIG